MSRTALLLHHQDKASAAGLQGFHTELLMEHLIMPVIALLFWKTCDILTDNANRHILQML